jgi:hypothetical protein
LQPIKGTDATKISAAIDNKDFFLVMVSKNLSAFG